MPLFTGTPTAIDLRNLADRQPSASTKTGPFLFNSKLYLVAQVSKPTMYSRPESGGSYTRLNAAGELATSGVVSIAFDPAHSKIHFIGLASGTLVYYYFNLSSDTWGSLVTSSISALSPQIYLLSTGEVGAVYAISGSPGQDMPYVPIAAGAFGTPAALVAGSDYVPVSVGVDGADLVHVFAFQNGVLPRTLYYLTFAVGGSIGSPVTAVIGTGSTIFGLGNVEFCSGDICVAWIDFPQLGPRPRCKLIVGHPAGGSPAWNVYPLHGSLDSAWDDDSSQFAKICQDAGALYTFFAVSYYPSPTSGTVVRVYRSTYAGSAPGEPDLYWDILTNPPAGVTIDPGDEFVFALSARMASGAVQVIGTTIVDNDEDEALVEASIVGGGQSGYRNRVLY